MVKVFTRFSKSFTELKITTILSVSLYIKLSFPSAVKESRARALQGAMKFSLARYGRPLPGDLAPGVRLRLEFYTDNPTCFLIVLVVEFAPCPP